MGIKFYKVIWTTGVAPSSFIKIENKKYSYDDGIGGNDHIREHPGLRQEYYINNKPQIKLRKLTDFETILYGW